jgi:hypothetical protein
MERTQLKRRAQRGSHDRATIDAIIDEALVCHVGFTAPHGPMVIPTTHVRLGDLLYLHGAAGNAMLSTATECCVAITLLDALVLGKTAMHHSVNYRSVIIFGRATRIDDPDAKRAALAALLDKVEPGRADRCRPPNPRELAITLVVAIPVTEASAKIRTGPPVTEDDPADADLPFWSGIIPLVTTRAAPIPPRT